MGWLPVLVVLGALLPWATPAPPGAIGRIDPVAIAGDAPRVVDQRQITIEHGRVVALSPNGRLLAVLRESEDPPQLCVVAVEAADAERCADLTGLGSKVRLDSVVWSPDSTRIAFAEDAFVTLNDGDLWLMDATTGTLTDLTDDGFAGPIPIFEDAPSNVAIDIDATPAWSPDGRELAFSRSTWRDGDWTGTGIYRFALSDPSRAKPELVYQVSRDEPGVVYFGMLWTPDGKRLVYNVAHADIDHLGNGLWTIAATGGSPHRIILDDPDRGPPVPLAIAATGDRALVIYAMAVALGLPGPSYALVDLTAVGKAEPIDVPDSSGPNTAFGQLVTFSPDGRRLLLAVRPPDAPGQLVVRDLATGADEVLLDSFEHVVPVGFGHGLTWATNGAVFVPTDLGAGVLLRLAGDGATATPAAAATPTAAAASPVATPTSEIAAGTTVVVNDANVALRSAPSTDAPIVAELAQGTELVVIGPAESGGGFRWWPVRDPTTRTLGYVRAELLSPRPGS